MSFCLKTMLQSGQARAFPLLVTILPQTELITIPRRGVPHGSQFGLMFLIEDNTNL